MTALTLAQSPPPASPQPLPTEIQGLLANWISIGLGFVAVASVVFWVVEAQKLLSRRRAASALASLPAPVTPALPKPAALTPA